MNSRTIALIIVVVILAGCAAPQVSLTKQVQVNIDRVEGVLIISQNNLDVTVQAINPGNSGLIGALIVAAIDSARQSNAEKVAAPMLEPLRGYNFRTVMLEASNDALGKIDRIKFAIPLNVEVIASDSAKRIAFDESTASAIIFCNVNYRLESGNLVVVSGAEMYPKMDTLKQFRNKPKETNPLDSGNVIYRKAFTFTEEAVTPTTIKESLSEAATNISQQLASDLNHGF